MDKYQRMLEERRGHNYQYPNDEQYIKLQLLGYKEHKFSNGKLDTISELDAKELVTDYRLKDNYSRIICFYNDIIGLKTFTVIYRSKQNIKIN